MRNIATPKPLNRTKQLHDMLQKHRKPTPTRQALRTVLPKGLRERRNGAFLAIR
jgi:hypothetical protein